MYKVRIWSKWKIKQVKYAKVSRSKNWESVGSKKSKVSKDGN